ncbi:hypothetical protein [Vibrio marisflavi]|uniref:Uncharacterized protein n=1 Tax=Vibrio marisflavi CECT 7928 TaxID=634439 RepID=A0ABM9A802_9VIBR|nr:hypothetical protein [Vibrio marisflavi]CAH0541603.1 hypothetical protein VMF7928_03668 [Vibrio marisflavi CECT 7928]
MNLNPTASKVYNAVSDICCKQNTAHLHDVKELSGVAENKIHRVIYCLVELGYLKKIHRKATHETKSSYTFELIPASQVH